MCARSALREQIVLEAGILENEGVFSVEAQPDRIADALFQFGQAMTKIHDLTFLSRERVASTFYEDLKALLLEIIDEEKIEAGLHTAGCSQRKQLPRRLPL